MCVWANKWNKRVCVCVCKQTIRTSIAGMADARVLTKSISPPMDVNIEKAFRAIAQLGGRRAEVWNAAFLFH